MHQLRYDIYMPHEGSHMDWGKARLGGKEGNAGLLSYHTKGFLCLPAHLPPAVHPLTYFMITSSLIRRENP